MGHAAPLALSLMWGMRLAKCGGALAGKGLAKYSTFIVDTFSMSF
jgi:hypothetical protein